MSGGAPVDSWIEDKDAFLSDLPLLQDEGYRVTSKASGSYNCIALSVRDHDRWYWPGEGLAPDGRNSYWPPGCTRDLTVEAFVEMFSGKGFEVCDSDDFEPGYEKVAIFVCENGEPAHAALQRADRNGAWRSKIGFNVDVEHELRSVECDNFGTVHTIMKRQLHRR